MSAPRTQQQQGYVPAYPVSDGVSDPTMRAFITEFYRISDRPEANELWLSCFTEDARVCIGSDTGHGHQEIRELRGKMWELVAERKHSVYKVFPARFEQQGNEGDESRDGDGDGDGDDCCHVMLIGDVELKTHDGDERVVSWAGYAVLTRVMVGALGAGAGEEAGEEAVGPASAAGVSQEWKFSRYRVWLQK